MFAEPTPCSRNLPLTLRPRIREVFLQHQISIRLRNHRLLYSSLRHLRSDDQNIRELSSRKYIVTNIYKNESRISKGPPLYVKYQIDGVNTDKGKLLVLSRNRRDWNNSTMSNRPYGMSLWIQGPPTMTRECQGGSEYSISMYLLDFQDLIWAISQHFKTRNHLGIDHGAGHYRDVMDLLGRHFS